MKEVMNERMTGDWVSRSGGCHGTKAKGSGAESKRGDSLPVNEGSQRRIVLTYLQPVDEATDLRDAIARPWSPKSEQATLQAYL